MRRATRRNLVVLASIAFGAVIVMARTIHMHTRPKMLPSRGTVRRVVDGDTFHLTNGLTVRLCEIDAPELFGERAEIAKRAHLELKNMIYRRQVRMVSAADHIDQYGRFIAYVFLASGTGPAADELFVNAEMVRRGMARAKTWTAAGDRYGEIEAAEEEARAAQVGLWAPGQNAR
jgi:micrococcal nuclease